jgi:hypothetical protein
MNEPHPRAMALIANLLIVVLIDDNVGLFDCVSGGFF